MTRSVAACQSAVVFSQRPGAGKATLTHAGDLSVTHSPSGARAIGSCRPAIDVVYGGVWFRPLPTNVAVECGSLTLVRG